MHAKPSHEWCASVSDHWSYTNIYGIWLFFFECVCAHIYFFILGGINILVCFLKHFSLSWWWVANHQVLWLAHRKLLPKWMPCWVCVCVCPSAMGTNEHGNPTATTARSNYEEQTKKWAKMRATLTEQQQQQQQQGNENVIIETYQIRDGSFNWTTKYI